MADIIKETLKKIEEKNIAPKPKWRHSLKEYGFWVFFGISIIIGALATSTIIYLLANHDWEVHKYLHESLFEDIFSSLPYLWIIILALLIIFAFSQFKKTKSGYKYNPYLIAGVSVILSLLFGMVLFYSFLDLGINEFFSRHVPIYNSLVCSEETVWNNVGSGLVNGEVTAVKDDDDFTLKDCNGKVWQVQYDESQGLEKISVKVGMRIKMVGTQEGDSTFIVKIIRPLERLRRPTSLKQNNKFQIS